MVFTFSPRVISRAAYCTVCRGLFDARLGRRAVMSPWQSYDKPSAKITRRYAKT
ncbi:hypothetical protein ACI1S4_03230 [Lactococcus petauri]|uniref:hypothetical protein n=1 Tax=Lactococcus petauri TaxID=1940789 RepID=UPI003854F09D